MTYEPTLTAYTPYLGAPGIQVVFGSFDASTATVNVWRTAGGRQMTVRGGADAPVSGAWAFFDPEAPFGVPSTYFAEMFDSDGISLGVTGNNSITIDSDVSWIHNPLHPQGATPVRTGAGTGATVTSQADVNVYYPVGRRAGVAVTGPRRGLAQVPLRFYADTDAVSDAIDGMFGTINGDLTLPPIVCVRLASGMANRLPRPLFVAVPNPTATPVNAVAGGSVVEWDLTGAEVDPPTPALAEAVLSHADLDTYYPSRAARDTAYQSRLAMDTDFRLAGYANGGGTVIDPGTTNSQGIYGAGIYGVDTGGGIPPSSTPTASNGDGTAAVPSSTVTDHGDGTATI